MFTQNKILFILLNSMFETINVIYLYRSQIKMEFQKFLITSLDCRNIKYFARNVGFAAIQLNKNYTELNDLLII